MTIEHQRIVELASDFDITDVDEWSTMDIIKWKTFGGDEHLQKFENEWIDGYSDVINAAASENDIPPYLLAGVLKIELGGAPLWEDPLVYNARAHLPDFLKVLPQLEIDKDNTSFGNVSMQIRRAAETLGYSKDLSDDERALITDSLTNSTESIFICAAHISDLRDADYSGISASDLTEEQVSIIGSRYNVGPEVRIDSLPTYYGTLIIQDRADLEELLK